MNANLISKAYFNMRRVELHHMNNALRGKGVCGGVAASSHIFKNDKLLTSRWIFPLTPTNTLISQLLFLPFVHIHICIHEIHNHVIMSHGLVHPPSHAMDLVHTHLWAYKMDINCTFDFCITCFEISWNWLKWRKKTKLHSLVFGSRVSRT